MDLTMKPNQDQPSHYRERQAERTKVLAKAQIHQNARYSVEVRIRDVSQCGFMAECDEPVGIGSYVALDVPGIGAVRAQVRWQIGGRMGGMFLNPISLDRCEWTAVKTDPPSEAA
jgi:hypothetical protein